MDFSFVKGWQKVSLIDYPSKISTIIFVCDCNFHCPFCHNPSLAVCDSNESINMSEFFLFLDNRKGKIDGVVISGGEPSLHPKIPNLIDIIQAKGYEVKLDTNASTPSILDKCSPNYVAIDLKTSFKHYSLVCDILPADMERRFLSTIEKIEDKGIDYEVRMTVVPTIVEKKDLEILIPILKRFKRFIIQQFNPKVTLYKSYQKLVPYSDSEIKAFASMLEENGVNVCLRV